MSGTSGSLSRIAPPVADPAPHNLGFQVVNLAIGSELAFYPGAADTWSFPAGGNVQSVTVSATFIGDRTAGDSVSINVGGNVAFMVEGQTLSWSVAQDRANEVVPFGLVAICAGNAAATVNWTEHL